jgi:hypothetical protein
VNRYIGIGLFLAGGAAGCWAQSVAVGAIGGIRTSADTPYVGESRRYAVGPAVALGLPRRFAVEIEAIYRREGYAEYFPTFGIARGYGFEAERSNSWEFPVLAKYGLPLRLFHVEAGYAPRVIRGSVSESAITYLYQGGSLTPVYTHETYGVDYPVSHGLVLGGGMRFALGRFSLAPVLRYTHWNNALPLPDSSQNQLDVLLGIGLRVH